MIEPDFTFYMLQFSGIRSVRNIRFGTHEFHKAFKPGAALGINFHKLYQFPHR